MGSRTNDSHRYKQYDANYPEDQREEDTNLDVDLRTKYLSGISEVSSVAEIIHGGCLSTCAGDCSPANSRPAKQIKESVSSISDTLSSIEAPCVRAARADASWSTIFRWSFASSRNGDSGLAGGSNNLCHLDLDDDLERASAVPPPLFAQLARPKPENRAELDAAIATYLKSGAEKELNISHALRQRTLGRLRESSDPRHLKPVADHIYEVMKNCSHRNFVSLGVQTGTYETICVGNLIGILNLIAGFLLVLLRALYPHLGTHSRWNVFYAFPLWSMGTTLMLGGTQGMCFILLSLSRRQAMPWERFEEESQNSGGQEKEASTAKPVSWWRRYRAFMSRTMAHDRNYRVEDKNLRKVQRMILFQCLSYGVMAAGCCVMLFIFLPIWAETVPGRTLQTRTQ